MPTANNSNHTAIGTLDPHRSAACVLYVTLHCPIPTSITEKCAASLTGDINPQSSHWNNGKMKIAYNSAYVQLETVNFTFNRQAIIVHFYLCSNFQEIAMLKAKY